MKILNVSEITWVTLKRRYIMLIYIFYNSYENFAYDIFHKNIFPYLIFFLVACIILKNMENFMDISFGLSNCYHIKHVFPLLHSHACLLALLSLYFIDTFCFASMAKHWPFLEPITKFLHPKKKIEEDNTSNLINGLIHVLSCVNVLPTRQYIHYCLAY